MMRHIYPAVLLKSTGWLGAGLLAGVAAQAQPASPVPVPRPHWQPSIYLDNRNPFEQAAAVRVIGLNVGVTPPGKPYRLGITGYTLRRSYAQYYTYAGRGKNQRIKDTYTPELNLLYFTPSFTYTFFTHRFVELNVPADVGLGRSHYTVTDENGRVVTNARDMFIPAEIGLGVLLKPTRWVGVSGGVGYRVALSDVDFKDDFNGWYYCYRLTLFVGPLWHDLRAHCREQLAWLRAHPQPAAPAPDEPAYP